MKIFLLLALTGLVCGPLRAQSPAPDPLALTLANGKVLHFQTLEQKQRFEAGLARMKPGPAAPAPAPTLAPLTASTPAATPAAASNGLDFTPAAGPGVGNPTAPIFTAVYYLTSPDSWVGKKVTIAIAYLEDKNEGAVKNGLRQFDAVTWNNTTAGYLDSDSGGRIAVYAKPEVATRLMQSCGAKLQALDYSSRYKTTMVQGVFGKIASPGKNEKGNKRFCVYVDK